MPLRTSAADRSRPASSRAVALVLALVMTLCLLLAPTPGHAQQADAPSIDATLDNARKQIDDVQKALRGDVSDEALVTLRDTALAARAMADQAATTLAPQLASVEARLAELGTPAKDVKEAPDVVQQRTQLDKSRSSLDAQLKLARLLTVEGDQAAEQIRGTRRSLFQAQLGERTSSILATGFWNDLRADLPRDTVRLQLLLAELTAHMRLTPPGVWAMVVLAIVLVVVARIGVGKLLLRLTSTKVPPGRLRRSLHALFVVILGTITPGLIAMALYTGITWNDSLGQAAAGVLASTAGAVWFSAYVAALGAALLSPGKPSWRLPAVPDRVAWQMRWFPVQLAVMVLIAWVTERLAALVNASLASTVAVNCIVALALAAVMVIASMRIEHLRRQTLRDVDQPIPPRPLWLAGLAALSSIVLFGSLICLLMGYVAFGSFAVKQIVWIAVVVSSGYLLAVLIDDVCMGVLASTRETVDASGKSATPTLPEGHPRGRDQVAVLLSGVLRLLVLLFGITLVLAPFGDGPTDLFRRANQIQTGLSIGEVLIRPGTVIQALAVLGIGWFSVTWMRTWLTDRYLPTTALDPGMQTSAATLFGYAGYVLAVALAMSAVGIGLERVAWVASALSVGIGFGLQAVVQNFVSGLILLAERPVKVGDWVSLGGVEGDIRRINVRATEIQMGDRSTVIVPNSEFITKTVRNVTHASPLGLVQMKLPMPLDSDVQLIRELVLAAFDEHPDVLKTPPPKVQLDGVETDRLIFNATGSVSSPRAAYGVRSDLLFEVLGRLANARKAAKASSATPAEAAAVAAALQPVAASDPVVAAEAESAPGVPGSPVPDPKEDARQQAAQKANQPPTTGAGGLPVSS
ncbi:DUF3772 domain-containing protein [soil metagenome]